jgi:hypothetical protein
MRLSVELLGGIRRQVYPSLSSTSIRGQDGTLLFDLPILTVAQAVQMINALRLGRFSRSADQPCCLARSRKRGSLIWRRDTMPFPPGLFTRQVRGEQPAPLFQHRVRHAKVRFLCP